MSKMKAVRIHTYGGPETLRFEEIARPEPADGEVLVRVAAAGVNALDWKVRAGHLEHLVSHRLPLVPGWDLSGTIAQVGAGVTGWSIGAEVYAHSDFTKNGAYAEYVVVAASELSHRPRTLDHIHAAAVPMAALTAWQSLCEASGAAVAAGQTVLVHGGAGGVGHFTVQLAKALGAYVIATGSPSSEQFIRDLGADEFIDRTRYPFEEVVMDVDVVVDTIGADTLMRSWKVLKRGGVLIGLVSAPSPKAASTYGVRGVLVRVRPNAVQLGRITQLIDGGTIKPRIAEVLPLAHARRAHEISQAGRVQGKLVLRV